MTTKTRTKAKTWCTKCRARHLMTTPHDREQTQDEKLQEIGRRAFESIAEMVGRLDFVNEGGEPDEDAREKAIQEIQEDPLSVQVRSDWHAPGEDASPGEFEILLATGGPAVRIIGDLDMHGEPMRAMLQSQDWGTPWTEYRGAWGNGGAETLLAYARQFYFGEG